ncbi:MAG: glycosyltransferase family 4 protein, partial [Promethearchaeota archaeon]
SKVIKILKKHRIDLIHVDYCYGINILRLITKIPISYNAHNVEGIYWKETAKNYYKIPIFLRSLYAQYIYLLEKYTIKFVKNINAISYDDKKKFIEIYNIPEEKIFVNNMGYKKEIFNNPIKQEKAREKLKVDKNKFIVIFHGFYYINLPNRKAIKIIKDQISPRIKDNEILFLIAGKMPPFKNKKNLKFLGFLDDLRYLLYAADIAIVPIFRGSGVRIKMIDYLSAKLPMISTEQANLGLIFENNIHGYIVSNKEPIEDMINKILELKNNPEKINKIKNNLQKLLEEKYNWDKILKELEKKYLQILKRT